MLFLSIGSFLGRIFHKRFLLEHVEKYFQHRISLEQMFPGYKRTNLVSYFVAAQ